MSSFVLTIGFSSSITFLFSSSDRSLTVWCFTHKMYHHSSYFLTTSGCMLCLGRANYFRFNHPEQAMRLRGTGPLSPRSEDTEAATHQNSTNGGEFLITKFSFSHLQVHVSVIYIIVLWYDKWKPIGHLHHFYNVIQMHIMALMVMPLAGLCR